MSTRAVYTFKNSKQYGLNEVHIYKHHDGYPKGAISFISNAIDFRDTKDMNFPKNKRDSLAISFLLSNTSDSPYGSDCELTSHYKNHGDLEYRYEIEYMPFIKLDGSKSEYLNIKIFQVNSFEDFETLIFDAPIEEAFKEYLIKEVS